MTISADLSSVPTSIYQNIQSNQPAKLDSDQMKILAEKDPIYDIPQNNRPLEKLPLYKRVSRIFSNLYKRISNLFSRKPNQIELLKGEVQQLSKGNTHLNLYTAQLHHYICANVKRIEHLEGYIHFLKYEVDSKEDQINSLKETIFSMEEDLYSNRTQVSQDSGFVDTTEKKQSFFSKTSQLLKNKIG